MELEVPGPDEPGLDLEVGVLKRMQHSHHAVRYIDSGKIATLNFIVMELVGCNLSDLRKACPDHRFTLCTSLRLGLQCLDAIEAMHASGLLHRDIKPANYALGRTVKDYRTVYILDFGLVRRWRLKNGKVRPPRNVCGFRGKISLFRVPLRKTFFILLAYFIYVRYSEICINKLPFGARLGQSRRSLELVIYVSRVSNWFITVAYGIKKVENSRLKN